MVESIVLAFIPLFVAVDPLGMLPVFLSLTGGMDGAGRRTVARQAVLTALLVSLGFLVAGKFIFRVLHITSGDFLVAGGAILFVLAIRDLTAMETEVHVRSGTVGVVPLGTPLIAGPAVLTTSLVMVDTYGWFPTLVAVVLNLLIAGVVFSAAEVVVKVVGQTGLRIISKIVALFLAAIGVLMVRMGLMEFLGALGR
jgi:multiple antibiotic resistance protein